MANSFGEAFENAVYSKLNKNRLENDYAQKIVSWLQQSAKGVDATQDGSTVKVAVEGMRSLAAANNITFVDLKPYFQNSPKAKRKKNGGWYIIIPLGVGSKKLRQVSFPDYTSLSHSPVGTTASIGSVSKFQDVLQGEQQSGLVNSLRYNWQSNNVTRELTPSGKRSSYISFRTVSDKSAPNSWIVGRQAFSKDNTSEITNTQMQTDIKNLFLQAAKVV